MKVLFIGEGPHDIGASEFALKPHPAAGVIPILARKVCPTIGTDNVGYYWREIPVLNREKKRRGFAAKVASAIVLAARHQCQGTICVADRDGDERRLPSMEEGIERGLAVVGDDHRAACAVAVESVEAWTLGAPSAVAAVLGKPNELVLQQYKLSDVEEYNQNSGKAEKRPKDLLGKVAGLTNMNDCAEWRELIADATAPDELCQNCPHGFKPFAEKLKAAFGPR